MYGRDREVETLLAAFDRVVAGGRPELVLVSGYSGIGKSRVVNELHKPLVPPRGLFASGKFDQYKRDIPYATLAQAFQALIRPLLSRSEAELTQWGDALRDALEPNGHLMIGLVPELKAIIGEQPRVAELPAREAQARFHLVFRRFIGVFARPERPLALFLDDLQWLDAATLDLLEDLLTQPDVSRLLLIGAYRDNEVGPTHPLARKLEAMRSSGALLHDIVLTPLTGPDLEQLITDALHCAPAHARPLAQLVHDKTAGESVLRDSVHVLTVRREPDHLRPPHRIVVLGPDAHSRQGLFGQRRRSNGAYVVPVGPRHAERIEATGLPGQPRGAHDPQRCLPGFHRAGAHAPGRRGRSSSFSRTLRDGLEPILLLDDEQGLEVFYTAEIIKHLRVTGNLQWVDSAIHDAEKVLVWGLRTRVGF